MKSIVATYPDFQALPKGVKQLLVTTETLFFEDVRPPATMGTARKSIWTEWETQKPVVGGHATSAWQSP